MRRWWPLALATAVSIAACSARGDVRPPPGEISFSDGTAVSALAKVRDTVSRLIARGPDGSVFILEPDAADHSRVADALLLLGGTPRPRDLTGLLSRQDRRTGLFHLGDEEDHSLLGTWKMARLSTALPHAPRDRIHSQLTVPELAMALDRRAESGKADPPARWNDERLFDFQRALEIATISGASKNALFTSVERHATDWCTGLQADLNRHRWDRAASVAGLLSTAHQSCPAPRLDREAVRFLDTDPTKQMGDGIEWFPAAAGAVDRATIRRHLRLGTAPPQGCLRIAGARTRDTIPPTVSEPLVERCAEAVKLSGAQVQLSPDVRKSLQRTVDTGGGLPESMQSNARSLAFQWESLRLLGYPRKVTEAVWKGMADPAANPTAGTDAFLRDLLVTPSSITRKRVDAVLGSSEDRDQRALAISTYVRRTHSCRPELITWMKEITDRPPPETNYGLLGHASLISAQRVCGAAPEVTAVDRGTRDTVPVTDRSTIIREWLGVEARCLAGLTTPAERLRRDLTVALRQDFGDARLGSRVYYAVLRTAQILDQGCAKAWWT